MCSQRDLRVPISSDDDKNLTFKKKHFIEKTNSNHNAIYLQDYSKQIIVIVRDLVFEDIFLLSLLLYYVIQCIG